MSSKKHQDSGRSKEDSELKNPGRRQVLGVAAVAAAFTAGQVGSVEAKGEKKPSRNAAAAPSTEGDFGELVNPADLPGGKSKPGVNAYQPVSQFHDLGANQVFKKGALYRQSVSKYAKDLRKRLGLPDSDFMHVVRLEPKPGGHADGHCACCCC
jgi:hypothetical protein